MVQSSENASRSMQGQCHLHAACKIYHLCKTCMSVFIVHISWYVRLCLNRLFHQLQDTQEIKRTLFNETKQDKIKKRSFNLLCVWSFFLGRTLAVSSVSDFFVYFIAAILSAWTRVPNRKIQQCTVCSLLHVLLSKQQQKTRQQNTQQQQLQNSVLDVHPYFRPLSGRQLWTTDGFHGQ